MTFFDKLFTIRNRSNKGDNGFKLAFEPLSFRSSVFEIAKSQIRVVLFRECDRRGRKLLFDSNAVEKLPLVSHIKAKDILCKTKHEQVEKEKLLEFVEVTNTHGYKYKKPQNDVTLLGEMIFGSVAMVFKGGTTCKIHNLTSPKCVVFTNIIHAPTQCHYLFSSQSFGTNTGVVAGNFAFEYPNEERTSSSDSKLYRHREQSKNNPSTYPCMKHKPVRKKLCHCEAHSAAFKPCNKILLHERLNLDANCKVNNKCESLMCVDSNVNCGQIKDVIKETGCEYSGSSVSSPERENCECKCEIGEDYGSFSDFYECNKDTNCSMNAPNGSLGSLRRRWMQSCASSVDEGCYEEVDYSKNKTRTKLGIGLVVDLTNNLEGDLEKFLFNHTIVIESILNKLQSSIEAAYMKKENFVDLTYTAFINCQQSVHELITGGKYTRPMWLTLTEAVAEEQNIRRQGKAYSQFHENIKDCKTQDTLNNVKLKFLNDFCDVLLKFDTKDTNFFVSTLLTAVLTHHLSWVTGIAESDISLAQPKLQSVVKGLRPYNPIWAQLNDLNGILGSPLKSARTVITGSETSKNNIACVIQVLTYFIRCYNVVENVYDFDFEQVTRTGDLENTGTIYAGFDRDLKRASVFERASDTSRIVPVVDVPVVDDTERTRLCTKEVLQSSSARTAMRKSSSCLFRSERDVTSPKCETTYPSVQKFERLEIERLSAADVTGECADGDYFCDLACDEKVQKLIRVPSKAVLAHLMHNFSPGKECCTTAAGSLSSDNYGERNSMLKESSDDVLFVLGESDELVNLKKAATDLSSVENSDELHRKNVIRCGSLGRSKSSHFPVRTVQSETSGMFQGCGSESKAVADATADAGNISAPQKHSQDVNHEVSSRDTVLSSLRELQMPRVAEKVFERKRLDISSVLGSVNDHYNSEQIIQGVLEDRSQWENLLRRDLALYAHNPVVDRSVTEALCIIGDMNSWEVSLYSSRNFSIDHNNFCGVRIGMSQLVADMLESLLYICRIKLPPDFCFGHIERKLREIYSKSKSVAELLNSTEMCSIEYLTSRLDVTVNDVPLLLSVATTHSPHISSKYGLTFA